MSELVRWKEYRVRQEIYKKRLKQNETSADRVDSSEANGEVRNGISLSFFELASARGIGSRVRHRRRASVTWLALGIV
jgi:hypothetical protein